MKDQNRLLASGLFIVLSFWLAWTIWWTLKLYASLPDIYAVTDPLGKLYLSSTLSLIFLWVGLNIRTIGAALSIFTAYKYYKSGWNPNVRRLVAAVLILEGIYLVSIIPTAWVGPDVGDFVLIPEATIPSLFEAIFVPIPLFIAAAGLKWPDKMKPGFAARWVSISAVMYVFALFVRFTGQWIATFIQTPKYTYFFGGFPSHGVAYVLDYPLNMFSFLLTVVGLPLLAVYGLVVSWPAIRGFASKVDVHRVGLALTLLGAYFMVCLFMIYALPGYVGGKAIWSSFFSGHNVDLWMLALPMLGIPLMFMDKNEKET